jgi:hypothetical protein
MRIYPGGFYMPHLDSTLLNIEDKIGMELIIEEDDHIIYRLLPQKHDSRKINLCIGTICKHYYHATSIELIIKGEYIVLVFNHPKLGSKSPHLELLNAPGILLIQRVQEKNKKYNIHINIEYF